MSNFGKPNNKLETKKLYRPNLGATFVSSINKDVLMEYGINNIDFSFGVVIINPKEGYPLYENDFKNGDVIVSINNKKISNTKNIQKRLIFEN